MFKWLHKFWKLITVDDEPNFMGNIVKAQMARKYLNNKPDVFILKEKIVDLETRILILEGKLK